MRKYFRAVRKQAVHLLLSKGAMATFALLLTLVLLSFADNVNEFGVMTGLRCITR